MLASEILVTEIPTLSKHDSVAQAIEWMDEFKVMHLAVVDGPLFLGLVHEDYLLAIEDPTERISDHLNYLIQMHVYSNEHVFEVLRKVEEYGVTLIPILNPKELFVGVITVANLMEVIAEMPVVKSPGGVIVMDILNTDYSLTEIARIVESNDAKILGSFVSRNQDSSTIEVTLKINKLNIQDVIQALERFDYDITASYDQSDANDDLIDNYDNLMNYLNI
ncbi:hypothetical protein KFE98_09575 [bacterium SCSIO 12741]|nr:hypothetical protein KFE98_09575 [bacterium SCSIO 12741]